jgi:oligopeptide/dipeptide ABC transporter ATP-binding protein
MYRGRIVETGLTAAVFASARHPYTQALLSAVPRLDPDAPRERISFHAPLVNTDPPLREVGQGHFAAV